MFTKRGRIQKWRITKRVSLFTIGMGDYNAVVCVVFNFPLSVGDLPRLGIWRIVGRYLREKQVH